MEKELLELNEIAREDGRKFTKKRLIYESIKKEIGKKIFLAIIGPRGVGKTVLLRQINSIIKNSFYISLDTVTLERSLFEIAKELEGKGIKYLLLDEIHFLPNFEKELKKIFDFLNLRVIFTSSVSLSIYKSVYDLSRRVKVYYLYPFSFDEYLFFKKKMNQ